MVYNVVRSFVDVSTLCAGEGDINIMFVHMVKDVSRSTTDASSILTGIGDIYMMFVHMVDCVVEHG